MILSCNQLTFSYDSVVIEDVTFTAKIGDFICIVGENGSGKTTLVKAILGLLPTKSGSVQIKADVPVGYVPQKLSISRDFPACVEEIVRSGIVTKRPFLSRAEKETALHAMELFDITGLRRKSFRALSGGQQQRVLLARAFCASKEFLVLDEPVTGLDPKAVSDLYALLKKINEQEKTTILMVSHDIRAAMQIATKILHMDKTVQFFGAPEHYICSECGKRFMGGEKNA